MNAEGLIYDQTDAGAHRGAGYVHGITGLAVVEAAGMGNVPDTKVVAQKAVNYSMKVHQNEAGGFRYRPRDIGDLSVTVWYAMQLKSAKLAGLRTDPVNQDGIVKFIKSCEIRDQGPAVIFGYQPGNPHDNTAFRLTAMGCAATPFLGWGKNEVQASAAWFVLKGGLPDGWGAGKTDLYYLFGLGAGSVRRCAKSHSYSSAVA